MPRISSTLLRRHKYYQILLVLMLALALFLCLYGILPSSPTARAQDAEPDGSQRLSARARQQIEALIAEKKARTPVQRKIDSHLLAADKMRRGEPVAEGVLTLRTGVEVDSGGRVLVDIDASVSKELLKQVEAAGGEVINSFPQYNAIRARIPLEQIERLAGSPSVKFIRLAVVGELMGTSKEPPNNQRAIQLWPKSAYVPSLARRVAVMRSQLPSALTDLVANHRGDLYVQDAPRVGAIVSEGDTTHRAAEARAGFSVDGTGVKIGVLSDSVDRLDTSLASGELSQVTVLPGQNGVGTCPGRPCSGEGTAMLEIIHDLAPGAQLFFATADLGPASFAQNIRNLRAVGCDIIVDDVGYADESPFQDDVIARAVNDVTAAGAIYFSSAGNSGNLDDGTSGVWEGDFVDAGDVSQGRVHSFGSSIFNTIRAAGRVNLFWADPLLHSANDYDLFVLDATASTVVAFSSDFQNGTQNPFETIPSENGPMPPPQLQPGQLIFIVKYSGAGRFLHLDAGFGGALSIVTAGQTRGHSCAVAAFGVAATPAFLPHGVFPEPVGPFPSPFNLFSRSEIFSSDGPRHVFFNSDGSAITPGNFSSTGGALRITPDITAADGVMTSVIGFKPFFGTSAAAPHAAAIAGLLKSLKPTLTPAQIRTALSSTAIDIEAPGVDRTTGVGIVMAFEALRSVATPNLTPFKPTGWSDKIVVSNVAGTNTDSSPLRTTDTLLVDLAVINSGTTATGSGFFVKLFVDGVERNNFVSNPLPTNNFGVALDQSIGNLSAGTHTIKVVADPTGAVPETNETDNEFTKSITVSVATATAQFSASTASVSETLNQTTRANLTVTRTGLTSGAASVSYATSNGTANDRSDYLAAIGTLNFAAGETSKSIPIFIVDDRFGEVPETFSVTLSNPIGCTLGSPSTTTVTINSNESANGTNPVKDASFNSDFFVREHYVDFFNREADTSGLAFWKNQIDSCTTQACREIRRINVSGAFFVSIEFQETGYLVERLYKAAYGNGTGNSTLGGNHTLSVPIVRLNEFLSDTQQIGRGVVIGAPGADALLENNKQALIAEFVQRARFLTAFPISMTPAQFVDKLNTNSGGVLSSSERNQLVNDLTSGAKTRAQVLRAVAEDSDLFNAETNRAFVLAQFFGYLRRNPNDLPDADYTGYDFWLGKLNQFNGNFVNAEMVKAFIVSGEYQQRFGP